MCSKLCFCNSEFQAHVTAVTAVLPQGFQTPVTLHLNGDLNLYRLVTSDKKVGLGLCSAS